MTLHFSWPSWLMLLGKEMDATFSSATNRIFEPDPCTPPTATAAVAKPKRQSRAAAAGGFGGRHFAAQQRPDRGDPMAQNNIHAGGGKGPGGQSGGGLLCTVKYISRLLRAYQLRQGGTVAPMPPACFPNLIF